MELLFSQKVCHFICVSELNDAEIATIGELHLKESKTTAIIVNGNLQVASV